LRPARMGSDMGECAEDDATAGVFVLTTIQKAVIGAVIGGLFAILGWGALAFVEMRDEWRTLSLKFEYFEERVTVAATAKAEVRALESRVGRIESDVAHHGAAAGHEKLIEDVRTMGERLIRLESAERPRTRPPRR